MRERERHMESGRSKYPANPEASSSHSKYGETRPLNLGCRIFLSHSGKDKDFVRLLHDKLVDLFHDDGIVFFDEKSLPTAEPISMENILVEARGCELGVLVLTKHFFMHTPNPMLELETLTTSKVKLLPLFVGISVEDFKNMRCSNVWDERWKQWLKEDEGRLRTWKHALSYVDRFSGLEYCKLAHYDLEFIRKVVAKVKRIIHPAHPFSEEGLWGMDRLCEIVNDMYKQCALERASDGCIQVASTSGRREDSNDSLDLLGMYGFAGLGKSTLCRCLCNFYCAEFHGKVCWLDLGSVPDLSQASSQTYPLQNAVMWRLRYLLSKLRVHIDDAHLVTLFELQNLVGNRIREAPIFLAIDNLSQDSNCRDEVDFYLRCKFAKGSKIFITARSKKILEQVIRKYTRFSAVIDHIPELKFEEAKGIFAREIPKLVQISNVEDKVKECVSACVVIHRHNDILHYHPLMLKSAAASITYDGWDSEDLKSRMRKFIRSSATIDKSDAWKMVFEMLDISYAKLSEDARKVFLDLSLFCRVILQGGLSSSSYAWIRCFYSHLDTEKLKSIFRSLEYLSFISMINVYHDDPAVEMHDLMVDFSKYKAMQGAGAMGFTPHYLVLENGAQLRNQAFSFLLAKASTRNDGWLSTSDLPKSVRTVSISGCSSDRPGEEVLDLRNLEGVEVLNLVDNPGVQEVLLSRTTVAHLRSFIVRCDRGSLRCTIDEDWPTPPTASQMTTGAELAWVELEGNVILSTCKKSRPWWAGGEQSLLQRLGISRSTAAPVCGLGILQPLFCNLQYLELAYFPAKSIDLTTCTNLKKIRLYDVRGLKDMHVLDTLTNLVGLKIESCNELLLLSIPANLRLSTVVRYCRSLERISLLKTSHQVYGMLDVKGCPALRRIDGIGHFVGKCWFERVGGLQEAIQELMEPFETGSLKFKASCTLLQLGGVELGGFWVQGLAGLRLVDVTDAQHVGLLISALVKAQPIDLFCLEIACKEDGDCGCDKNEPHFGPGLRPPYVLKYHCPQVRNLASLSLLGERLERLSLRGCKNVEVWPDFATMTTLEELDLSYTSLKECPTRMQLLPLKKLDIEGCWQLPAEEMIKEAITYCKPPGCSSAWGRGSLASLLADLRGHRRDRGSVADALDSRWPELVALCYEQWRYLVYPCPFPILYSSESGDVSPGTELCYFIMLMYDLWFGVEGEAGSACACADRIPTLKEKMKRLLCTEIFMALPFYIWGIGRTRLPGGGRREEYSMPEGYESYMAFVLIGSGSVGCFNASLNDDLKDRMVNFVQSFGEARRQHADEVKAIPVPKRDYEKYMVYTELQLTKEAQERLAMRVGDAVCKVARASSVAAALGQDFTLITMDGLKACYTDVDISDQETVARLFGWLKYREGSTQRLTSVYSWLRFRKPSMAAWYDTTNDGVGARVLHEIMLKIQPQSVLNMRKIRKNSNCGDPSFLFFLKL